MAINLIPLITGGGDSARSRLDGAPTLGVPDVVTVVGTVQGLNQTFTDLPDKIILPALSTRQVTTANNTIPAINASAQLLSAWTAGSINLFLNTRLVTGFPPLSSDVTTATRVTPDGAAPPLPLDGAPSATEDDVVYVTGLVQGVNLVFTDLQDRVILPALAVRKLTTPLNLVRVINGSAQLLAAWNAGQIALTWNGKAVVTFSPMQTADDVAAAAAATSPSIGGSSTTTGLPAPGGGITPPPPNLLVLPDATATQKGVLQLTGALTGTANIPQLSLTGVTPGVYTLSTVTVAGDGRITNAASGSVTVGGRSQRIVTSTPVIVAPTDDILLIQVAVAAYVPLPYPTANRFMTIKDRSGAADVNNITLSTATGQIDGSTTFVIASPFGSVDLIGDGVNWSIV